MDLRRLRAGEWLAAAGGIALIASLLLPWYGDESGFEAFAVIDILLTLIALVAVALGVLQATQDSPAKPVAAGVLSVPLGFLGFLLVLYRVLDQPDAGDVQAGAFLGLVATVAITAGARLSIATERVRGLPPDLEPELRPTPAP
jgi:amino acid transporter